MAYQLTRRAFGGTVAALALSAADGGWTELFDGHSLNGWRPSETKDSWKVADGALAADGKRSHLFYDGPFHGADFRNFELEVELMTRPGCNSGVYFHTAYQESGFPTKGFEVQVDNSYVGEGGYKERKMGGSLYGLRNIYKPFATDDQWFKLAVTVRGKNVQIRENGILLVDYTEPTPPVIPDGPEKGRFLDHGTFALQCHNEGSKRAVPQCAGAAAGRTMWPRPAAPRPRRTTCSARSSTTGGTTSRWSITTRTSRAASRWTRCWTARGATASCTGSPSTPGRASPRPTDDDAAAATPTACRASRASSPCRPKGASGPVCSRGPRWRCSTTCSATR